MVDLRLRKQDLVNNPTPRVAVCLCLDISPSMSGDPQRGAHPGCVGVPIDELNDGVAAFYDAVRADESAQDATEIAVVAFSYQGFVERDFEPVRLGSAPRLELELAKGGTSLGSAVETCLALLEQRKRDYQQAGVEYYQPWLVIITDGQPTDETHIAVAPRVADMVKNRKLVVFPIGVGGYADVQALALFSPTRPPLRLKGLAFGAFFEWLSQSIALVSQSQPGEAVKLNMEGIAGWGEL